MTLPLKFIIVDVENTHNVLSGEACKSLQLIKRLQTITETPSGDVTNEYPELFEGLGKLPGTYAIKLDNNVRPVVNAPRRVPVALQ